MQNRTIDERLQILNDYIQRTIDALNMTRQIAAQTLGSPMMQQQGLSHTPYMTWGQNVQQPQFVQTPQGLVPVYGLQQQNPFVQGMVPNVGFNVQQNPQFVPNFGYGLQHSTFAPQWSNVTPWTNIPVNFVPVTVPQYLGGQVGTHMQNRDLGLPGHNPQLNLGQTQI